jgi:phosphatidate cytidylyltransferase
MLSEPVFAWLAGGVVALLAASTVLGMILAQHVRSDAARATVANLNARVRSWWVMAGVFAAALVFGRGVTLTMFGVISFLALREFMTLTPTRPGDHRALFLGFFVVVPLQYWLIAIDWYGMFAVMIPVYVFAVLPAISVLAGDTQDFLARTAKVQWGLWLTIYALSAAPALLLLHNIPGYRLPPAMLLLYLMVVVQMSDVFQYVVGKLFGRTLLAPTVSPSKTVEGLVGGGLIAVGIGTALHFMTPFSPWQAAGMSVVLVIAGFLGGLVLSAIKRDLGAKDWGTAIGGHGGILDRMDSVCFAAPVFFHMTRYWFTV